MELLLIRGMNSVNCQCYHLEKLMLEPSVITGLGAGRVTLGFFARICFSYKKKSLKTCCLKLVFRLFFF